MVQVGGKSILHKWVFSRFTLFVILAACLFMSWSVYERFVVERDMAARRDSIELEYVNLEERRNALFEKVDYLKGDSGREYEVRKNFDVAEAGEQVVVIVDDETKAPVALTPGVAPAVAEPDPWWQFWR